MAEEDSPPDRGRSFLMVATIEVGWVRDETRNIDQEACKRFDQDCVGLAHMYGVRHARDPTITKQINRTVFSLIGGIEGNM
jgi:hypothetical protein